MPKRLSTKHACELAGEKQLTQASPLVGELFGITVVAVTPRIAFSSSSARTWSGPQVIWRSCSEGSDCWRYRRASIGSPRTRCHCQTA